MKKAKLVVMLTTSALAMSENGCASGAPRSDGVAEPSLPAAKLAMLNRAEIRTLLSAIEQAKEPEPQMGAMCYSPFEASAQLEYVCPRCGAKTKYADAGTFDMTDVERCRALIRRIPKHESMRLDESEFCRRCQPRVTAPKLRLLVCFDDGTTNSVVGVTPDDLELLEAALKGEKSIDGPGVQDSVFSKLPRLRELLGEKAAK